MTKKITVYPDADAVAFVGQSAGELNRAVEAFAWLMQRATADNEKLFSSQEWNYLAETLNTTDINDYWFRSSDPGAMLRAEVEAAHRLNRLGDKWFLVDGEEQMAAALVRMTGGKPCSATESADEAVTVLLGKIADLDAPHVWAVLYTTQFFWRNPEIDASADPWWTLAFRHGYTVSKTKKAGRASR